MRITHPPAPTAISVVVFLTCFPVVHRRRRGAIARHEAPLPPGRSLYIRNVTRKRDSQKSTGCAGCTIR